MQGRKVQDGECRHADCITGESQQKKEKIVTYRERKMYTEQKRAEQREFPCSALNLLV